MSIKHVDLNDTMVRALAAHMILRADPALTIVAVNDRYLEATGTRREAIVGDGLFEVFPDNPGDQGSTAVSDLRSSLNGVLTDRRADTIGVKKHDIPLRDGSGEFELRYWSPVNTPVFNPDGSIAHIMAKGLGTSATTGATASPSNGASDRRTGTDTSSRRVTNTTA